MNHDRAVLHEGGFSVLDVSLAETLARLTAREVRELVAAGLDADDLVRMVATAPPFNDVLVNRIHTHLLHVEK
jgi:hypothetical protein